MPSESDKKPDAEVDVVDANAPPKKKRAFTDRTAEALARGETGIGMSVPAAPPGAFKKPKKP